MKIAIIEPVGGHGGMNYYDFSLAEGLAASGADVTVYTCDKTTVPKGLRFNVRRSFKKIWGRESKVIRAARFTFCLLVTLRDAKQQGIELVHYHFFHYTKMETLCVSLARFFGFTIVITAHDVESFAGEYSDSAAGRILANVDKVIVHNRVSRKELKAHANLPVEKIAIIPHGNYLNVIPKNPSPAEAKNRLKLKYNGPVLLFFGQIKEVKGLDLLLQALPSVIVKFPTLKLLIAGKVWKDDFSKYESIIKKNNLQKHVILHIKYIPDQDVATYYRAVDLVVLPYRRIYQSGVLLMAMSYGVPTVVSNLEGMIEIVRDGSNGFVFEKGNPVHLADTLINALDNKELAKKISKAGLETMQEYYDWRSIGIKTLNLYKNL